MGIDVHQSGIERQIQHVARMPAVIQHVAIIPAARRSPAHGRAPRDALTNQNCMSGCARAAVGNPTQPESAQAARLAARCAARGQRNSAPSMRSMRCSNAAGSSARRQHRRISRPLCRSRNATCGSTERQALDLAQDVTELGALAAHELAPRRHVIKQVPHLDAGARRVGRGLERPRAAALDGELAGLLEPGGRATPAAAGPPSRSRATPRRESRSSRCPRGRRASQSCWWRGARARAAAPAAPARSHRRARGSARARRASMSISMRCAPASKRVLDQLLDHRGRTLDDLSGGDLIDQIGRKNPDRHAGPATAKGGSVLRRLPSYRAPRCRRAPAFLRIGLRSARARANRLPSGGNLRK